MKRDLYFPTPITNAAGMLGFKPDFRSLETFEKSMGVFVTNPISLKARKPASQPQVQYYPGGFLLHTGLPNPGFSAAVRQYSHHWRNADMPVIVHLMADQPEEIARMVERLETVENVMAAELGFAPYHDDENILKTVEISLRELPLIISLPREQVLTLGPKLIDAGVTAISVAAPRGILRSERGTLITGRLYGPALFPQALETIFSATKIGIPIIGAGGIYTQENLNAMMDAGALAIQVDSVLWRGGVRDNLSED